MTRSGLQRWIRGTTPAAAQAASTSRRSSAWSLAYCYGFDLHELLGTVKYPEAACGRITSHNDRP